MKKYYPKKIKKLSMKMLITCKENRNSKINAYFEPFISSSKGRLLEKVNQIVVSMLDMKLTPGIISKGFEVELYQNPGRKDR